MSIPIGDRIIIDRKTGKIIQLERMTPESLDKACRVIAKVLVDTMLEQQQKKAGLP